MLAALAAIALVFVILLGGVLIDRAYHAFARRHQTLGPFRQGNPNCGCCRGCAPINPAKRPEQDYPQPR